MKTQNIADVEIQTCNLHNFTGLVSLQGFA